MPPQQNWLSSMKVTLPAAVTNRALNPEDPPPGWLVNVTLSRAACAGKLNARRVIAAGTTVCHCS